MSRFALLFAGPRKLIGISACLALAGHPAATAAAPDLAQITRAFQQPEGPARMRVLDAIPRGGWDVDNLIRDVGLMQQVGFGGFAYLDGYEGHGQVFGDITVFPKEDRDSEAFMSPEHLRKINLVYEEAGRRNMRVMAPIRAIYFSGGPWITQDLAQKEYTLSKTFVSGGHPVRVQLPEPPSRDADAVPEERKRKYYRDALVVAWPVAGDPRQTAMYRLKPTITVSNPASHAERAYLNDGDGFSAMQLHGAWLMPAGPRPAVMPKPTTIDYEFPQAVNATACFIKLSPDRASSAVRGTIAVSEDGTQFRKLANFDVNMGAEKQVPLSIKTPAKWFRVEFEDITYRDTVGVAEIEFLEAGEEPVTKERIRNFAQKADRACWHESLVTDPAEYYGCKVFYEEGKAPAPGDVVRRSQVVDLTDKMRPDGTLEWDAPPGNWCVLRFGYTVGKHAFTVARHGGEGYECDLFNPAAARMQFENVPQRILGALSPVARQALQGFWFESLETGQTNWTARLPEDFRRVTGYDLTTWLPALADQIVDGAFETDAFLADFRRTLNLLFAENHHGVLRQLCEKNGLEWLSETGGSRQSGVDALLYLSRATVPMGEFWSGQPTVGYTNRSFDFNGRPGATGAGPWWSSDAQVKLPASVSHTYGNSQLVATESFTGADFDLHRVPAFDKHVADRAFCSGANSMYIAWWPNDRRQGALPGLHHWGWITPRNTTFRESSAFVDYISRCQALLQKGKFAADVLIAQDGSFHLRERTDSQTDPKVFAPRGYDFDFLSRELLLNDLKVENRALVLSSGMKYRVLHFPEHVNRMSVECLTKLEALLEAGAVVVAAKPEAGMSARDYADGLAQHRELVARIWSGLDGRERTSKTIGQGRLYWGVPVAEVLRRENVRPDFAYETSGAPAYVDHIHRRIDESGIEFYFLANAVNEAAQIVARFRDQGTRAPRLFDPLTGETRPLPHYRRLENGDVEIPLTFEPVGSLFVVFTDDRPRVQLASVEGPAGVKFSADAEGATIAEIKEPGTYRFGDRQGRSAKVSVENVAAPVVIGGPWQVDFADKFGTRFSRELTELRSFSENPDPQVKYFSGESIYRNRFVLPAAPDTRWSLELGKVRWVAEVKINGRSAGIAWCPPWRLDVTDLCRAGENTIEIVCANPWKNRLIGEAQLPVAERKTVVTNFRGVVFSEFKKMPLMEAGLLGPIRLTATRMVAVKFQGRD